MLELVAQDDASQLLHIGINACRLRLGALVTWRRLLDTEAIGAVVGDVEPSYSRDFQTFFTSLVVAVPEALKAIGVGATFGDKAGVDDQGLLMLGLNYLGNDCFVEGDKVEASVVPTRERTLVIGTVAAEIAKRGMAGKYQDKPQQMGDEFALWFLGLG